jgi:hypothetical protein
MNTFVALREPITARIASVKEQLPPGTRLVSLGLVDDRFLYYYDEPIRLLKDGRGSDWTYFCVGNGPNRPACRFAYEEIARVSLHQNRQADVSECVVIGRRLRAPLEVAAKATSSRY